jgi:hypothetical protein
MFPRTSLPLTKQKYIIFTNKKKKQRKFNTTDEFSDACPVVLNKFKSQYEKLEHDVRINEKTIGVNVLINYNQPHHLALTIYSTENDINFHIGINLRNLFHECGETIYTKVVKSTSKYQINYFNNQRYCERKPFDSILGSIRGISSLDGSVVVCGDSGKIEVNVFDTKSCNQKIHCSKTSSNRLCEKCICYFSYTFPVLI